MRLSSDLRVGYLERLGGTGIGVFRLLHRMTDKFLRKISKPKCDFGAAAAAQNKAMNWCNLQGLADIFGI